MSISTSSAAPADVQLRIELDREEDGRWIAEVTDLPGVLAYGKNREEALANVKALALRVIAEQVEHGETGADFSNLSFVIP